MKPGNHVTISSTTCFLSPRRVHAVSAAPMKLVDGARSLDAFPSLTRFALLASMLDAYDTITLLTGFVQCNGMDSVGLLPCMLFIYNLHNMSACRWLRLELRPWRVLLRSRWFHMQDGIFNSSILLPQAPSARGFASTQPSRNCIRT